MWVEQSLKVMQARPKTFLFHTLKSFKLEIVPQEMDTLPIGWASKLPELCFFLALLDPQNTPTDCLQASCFARMLSVSPGVTCDTFTSDH